MIDEKIAFSKKDLYLIILVLLAVMVVCFGFGYFFGRYEQILKNKSQLQIVPDVNCGRDYEPLQ